MVTLKLSNNPIVRGQHSGCPCPKQSFGVVECFTKIQWAPAHRFPIPYWCLQSKGFPCHEEGEDPGLCLGAAGLHQWVGVPTGVLFELAWELQKCMAPRWPSSGDDIVEVSLLKPMGDKHKHTPILDTGSYSSRWGNTTATSSRFLPRNLLSKVPLLVPLPFPPCFPIVTAATSPKRQRSLGRELMLTQIIPVDGFAFTSRRMI